MCVQISQEISNNNITDKIIITVTTVIAVLIVTKGSTQGMDNTNVLMDMITQMNNNFSSRLSVIENSLSKLGKIENDVTRVRADVENIKSDNSNFNQRLMDVEIFCQTNSDPAGISTLNQR